VFAALAIGVGVMFAISSPAVDRHAVGMVLLWAGVFCLLGGVLMLIRLFPFASAMFGLGMIFGRRRW
jgi:predicted Co/Zn/Cd cation transporter (cation efflux family)